MDTTLIKKSLSISIKDELIFISGRTQPVEIDNQDLEALLNETSTGKYPTLQLRMGIHLGIKESDAYLQMLLTTCEKYSKTKDQFKIIITDQLEKKLKHPIPTSPFILHSDISGLDLAQVADKISQAVPGVLLNEAALMGKPSYFHEKSTRYLPKKWFSESISSFFRPKPQPSHSGEELKLKESALCLIAKL